MCLKVFLQEKHYESSSIESEKQAGKLTIDGVIAYCMVTPDGSVSYYKKKEVL